MSTKIRVEVSESDFDIAALQGGLAVQSGAMGAIATFTGYVRSPVGDAKLHRMELEHYPGMTESAICDIATAACDRWPLLAITVVHRVGTLLPGEQIVWVGCSASHRGEALQACEFIMDYLKTRAPLWKREFDDSGAHWVQAKREDKSKAERWKINTET